MNDMIGFVLGNRQRERVIQVLGSKGSMPIEKIAKFERMTPPGIKKVLTDLAGKGLVAVEGEVWNLTEQGREVEKEIKRRA